MNNISDWHKNQISKYSSKRENFELYEKIMNQILTRSSSLYSPLAIVQARAKTISSFAEKCIRKADKYNDPVNELTDLCGGRIICHTNTQVKRICNFIENEFEVDYENSIDTASRLNDEEFGYVSVHYIVSIEKDSILGIAVPDEIKGLKAEIQVRTVLQHAWADIVHDLIYKTPIDVPVTYKREAARLAALLEKSDKSFEEMMNTLLDLKTRAVDYMCDEDFSNEENTLKTILGNEQDECSQLEISLRLAELYRAVGLYDSVIKTFTPFERLNPKIKFKFCYGEALVKESDYEDDLFKKGYSLLEDVVKSVECMLESGIDVELMHPEEFLIYKKTLHLISQVISKSDKNTSLIYAKKVFLLEPDNPQYLIRYIEMELLNNNESVLTLLIPHINSATRQCMQNINIHKSKMKSLLQQGRLLLLLEKPYEALEYYIIAIDFLRKSGKIKDMQCIKIEIESLELLFAKTGVEHYKWSQELLETALVLLFEEEDTNQENLLIIAGTSSHKSESVKDGFTEALEKSFSQFKGTVIGGGTITGIPGCVGNALIRVRENKECEIDSIGFIPANIDEIYIHKGYDTVIRTSGTDFSFLEVLEYWKNVAKQKYCPENIRILGFRGGKISNLEYRLGLSLGVSTGVYKANSSKTQCYIRDTFIENHENFVDLPLDVSTITVFLSNNNLSGVHFDDIDKIAKEIHDNYLRTEQSKGKKVETSLTSWEFLNEQFRRNNIDQALFFKLSLNYLGYDIKQITDDSKFIELKSEEIEKLAEMEHGRWNINRLKNGWKYSGKKDFDRKVTPYLVPWSELTDDIKQYDRDAVMNMIKLVSESGFDIYNKDVKE